MTTRVERVHDSTPILVGGGRFTLPRQHRPANGMSPLQLAEKAARMAIEDAGLQVGSLPLDSITHIASFTDPFVISVANDEKNPKAQFLRSDGLYPSMPGAVALKLGCPVEEVKELITTAHGGVYPQKSVSRAFEKIARGELRSALVLGCEAMHSFSSNLKQGVTAAELCSRWSVAELDRPGDQERLAHLQQSPGFATIPATEDAYSAANMFYTASWEAHGLEAPTATYPLFENALRMEAGRSHEEQTAEGARIFAGISHVAAEQPEHAWFGTEYSPTELSTVTESNRRVCFPYYNKLMNSIMDVDMSAAVLIMSVGEARARGVPRDKWIFLHGCSEADDRFDVLERPSLAHSAALRVVGQSCFRMAGIEDPNEDFQYMDIYSCFPSAVQVACTELNISMDDARSLTVTGGLPYHGGPGNNYVTHAIVAMLEKLRSNKSESRGLVTSNGGALTKHACAVYANFPDEAAINGTFRREDPAVTQAVADSMPRERVSKHPKGASVVENFVVVYGQKGTLQYGAVVGRLTDGPDTGARFVANLSDSSDLQRFVNGEDGVGTTGYVVTTQDTATFQSWESASLLSDTMKRAAPLLVSKL